MAPRVLVVDDEARIREVVQYALEKEGYEVSVARDGEEALEHASDQVDLVVLDVMLPKTDGLEVCRQIRQRYKTPVIFLSARSDEVDRIVGLELGGDDYLTKPFSPRELVARVRAVLRRVSASTEEAAESTETQLAHAGVAIDLDRHEVTYNGAAVSLTPTELGVLVALLERPGVVLSRKTLMERAYTDVTHVTERTIDTHVRRIRSKFRRCGGDPIATVHGVGYKASGA